MTEKNAVKSETVSPARELETLNAKDFLDGFEKAFRRNRRRPMQWADIEELMTTYAAHYVRSAMFNGYSFEELTRIINEHKAGSQAIGAAAKEAAEEIATDVYGDHGKQTVVKFAAIIVAAIEKARTK